MGPGLLELLFNLFVLKLSKKTVSRPATEIIYDNNEAFEIGKAKVLKQSSDDVCLVIAAGITLDQALKAYPKLEALGLKIRVMDPFTIKPIDKEGILKNAAECNGKIIVVEDHYSEGGIGDAVLDAVAETRNILVRKMCVREVPRSGPPMVLLEKFGIGTECIVKEVQEFSKVA